MQKFGVGDVHLKPSRGHVYIRQPVTVRTFDFLIWADAECVLVIFMKLSREHVQIRYLLAICDINKLFVAIELARLKSE